MEQMNVMLIVTCVMMLFFLIYNCARGFLQKIITTFIAIVASYAGYACCGPVSKYLIANTKIDDSIAKNISKALLTKTMKSVDGRIEELEAIDKIKVPEFVKTILIENNNSDMYDQLGVTSFYDYVGEYLSCCIVQLLTFLVIGLFLFLFVFFVAKALGVMTDFPVVRTVDHIGGLALGFAEGLLSVWILFSVVMAGSVFGVGWLVAAAKQIENNPILLFINNHNLILHFVVNVSRWIF